MVFCMVHCTFNSSAESFAKGDYVYLHNSARNMRDEYVKELEAAVPKVLFSKGPIISRYTFVLCIPVIY